LERAVASFSELETNENFLQHWQGMGFPFGLPFVAYLDALIIGYIIYTTYRIGNMEEDDSELRTLQLEYESLMVALERELSGYRYLSIQDINTAAAGTLQALLSSSQEIEKASTSFADSAKQAHDAIDGASKTVVNVFDPAVQRLDSVITSLSQAAGVHQQMVTLVQQVQSDFATEINTIRSGIAATLNSLDQRMSVVLNTIDTTMGNATDTMRTSLAAVAQTVETSMKQSVAAMDSAAQQAISSVSSAATSVAANVSQQTTQELRAIAQQLEKASREFERLMNPLDNTTKQVMVNTATLADDLQRIHDRLKDVANRP
jgi:ABC-type transporter Mla subunit MlaD